MSDLCAYCGKMFKPGDFDFILIDDERETAAWFCCHGCRVDYRCETGWPRGLPVTEVQFNTYRPEDTPSEQMKAMRARIKELEEENAQLRAINKRLTAGAKRKPYPEPVHYESTGDRAEVYFDHWPETGAASE